MWGTRYISSYQTLLNNASTSHLLGENEENKYWKNQLLVIVDAQRSRDCKARFNQGSIEFLQSSPNIIRASPLTHLAATLEIRTGILERMDSTRDCCLLLDNTEAVKLLSSVVDSLETLARKQRSSGIDFLTLGSSVQSQAELICQSWHLSLSIYWRHTKWLNLCLWSIVFVAKMMRTEGLDTVETFLLTSLRIYFLFSLNTPEHIFVMYLQIYFVTTTIMI